MNPNSKPSYHTTNVDFFIIVCSNWTELERKMLINEAKLMDNIKST